MLLSDAVDRYKADRTSKGYAAKTVKSEQNTLRHFLAAVGNIQVGAITPRHMDTFWSRNSDWAPATWNRCRSQLVNFFKWCQARGIMPRHSDPLEGTRKRKVPQTDWLVIPQQEWPTLLDAATDPRDRIMVALGLYLFTRISETTALQWKDIDFQNHEASVFRTKTQTLDVLPICEELEHELKVWKLQYAEMMGEHVKPGWYVVPAYSKPRYVGVAGQRGQLRLEQPAELLPTTLLKQSGPQRIKKALISAGYPVKDGDPIRALYEDDALGYIRDHVYAEVNDWSAFTSASAKS